MQACTRYIPPWATATPQTTWQMLSHLLAWDVPYPYPQLACYIPTSSIQITKSLSASYHKLYWSWTVKKQVFLLILDPSCLKASPAVHYIRPCQANGAWRLGLLWYTYNYLSISSLICPCLPLIGYINIFVIFNINTIFTINTIICLSFTLSTLVPRCCYTEKEPRGPSAES